MTNQAAAGTTPVVDGAGVRFTLFHDTRGPIVVEIASDTLLRIFHARSDSPDDLLDAYVKGQATIHEAAATKLRSGPILLLTDSDFTSNPGSSHDAANR